MDTTINNMTKADFDHIESTVQKEKARLFNFIRKQVPSTEDAEDIMQDTFVQLINSYKKINSVEKITSWLFRTARNKVIDNYRKKKPELFGNIKVAGGDDDHNLLTLEDILPDLSSSPDKQLARDLIWEKIQEALSEMPKKQRDVFVMHEFEDKSFNDISEITGDNPNTLFTRKRYAILYLRDRLKELYNEIGE